MPAVTVTQFAHTQHVPTDHGPQDEVWGCLELLLNPAAKVQFKWPNTVYTIGRDPKKVDCAFPGIALMSTTRTSPADHIEDTNTNGCHRRVSVLHRDNRIWHPSVRRRRHGLGLDERHLRMFAFLGYF